MGDFNIDLINPKNNNLVIDFVNEFRTRHFYPTITLPTRVTSHSKTLIDHIWVNTPTESNSAVLETSVSDHHAIVVVNM